MLWLLIFLLSFLVPISLTKSIPPPNIFKNEADSERFLSKMKQLHELHAARLEITIDWNDPIFEEKKLNLFMFEGDVMLSEEQLDNMIQDLKSRNSGSRKKRSITNTLTELWPNQINIKISPDVNYNDAFEAAKFWSNETCLRFVEKPNLGDSEQGIHFNPSTTGCFSSNLGRQNNGQSISIDPLCSSFATITHLIAHALGVYHEHNRSDRNEYVTITNDSVHPIYQWLEFYRVGWRTANDYVFDYDYGSNMHFGGYEYSFNGTRVLTTTDPNYQKTIGQMDGPSFADVKQMNRVYCRTSCGEWPNTCKNGGYLNPRLCMECKCPPQFTGPFCEDVNPGTGNCTTGALSATDAFQTLMVNGSRTCHFVITAPAPKQVYFELATLNVNSSPGPSEKKETCLYNYLEINYKTDFSFGGARFCNNTMPTVSRSQSNRLSLTYKGKAASRITLRYKAI